MTVPDAASLLQQFDALHHDARMRRLGQLVRPNADSAELDRLIAELETGTTYESYLAVRLAGLAGRVEPLMRALASGSVLVMESAAKRLPQVTSDADRLTRAYDLSMPAVRRSLLRHIVYRGHAAAADALFARVLDEDGPKSAMGLLPACAGDTVRSALVDYDFAVTNWRSLAIRHPAIVMAQFRQRLEAASIPERAFVWGRYRGALRHLYFEHADEIARLALEYGLADRLPGVIEEILGSLARRVPELTFQLLSAPKNRARLQQRGIPRSLGTHIRALSRGHRRELARLLAHAPTHLAALLATHPPADRNDLLTHARQQMDPARAPWNKALLEVLPHDARHREARRILARKDIQAKPMQVLEISAYLPFEAARAPLEDGARASDAAERAVALHALIHCAGLNRRGLEHALAFCQKIENEQDPVRLSVYQALQKCPPMLFEDPHADDLFLLLSHALLARDTSWQTRSCIQDLSIGLLQAHAIRPHGPTFLGALALIKELAKQSTHLALDLEHRLPPGRQNQLIDVLEAPLRASVQREDFTLLFLFARALGRRAWDSEIIQTLLEKATHAKPDAIADTAIDLWLNPPQTRDARVVELLRRDPSNLFVHAVFEHVHRRRQDLLDRYLRKRPIEGRLASGNTVALLPASGGFMRWLPRQQRAFGELLDEVVEDGGTAMWTRAHLIRVRTALLVTRLEDLDAWCQAEDVNIAEAALHGASQLDRPARSCDRLSEHLQSSRARVAIYSLYRPASYTAPAAVHRLLKEILSRNNLKLTVAKEAVRLLARLPSADNIALLFDYAQRPNLHADVRIACGRAARNLLHHPQAWAIVERLGRDTNPYVVLSFVDESWANLSTDDATRYLEIIANAAAHTDPLVRAGAVAALGGWANINPAKVAAISAEHLSDLDAPHWTLALQSLCAAMHHGDVQDDVFAAAQALRSRGIDAQPEALIDRDLPARQRLTALLNRIIPTHTYEAARLRPLLLRLDAELSQDVTLTSLRLNLRLSAIRWDQADLALQDLSTMLQDLSTTWLSLFELIHRFTTHLTVERIAQNEPALRALNIELASAPSPDLRRLGVALLSLLGPRQNWPKELVATLVQLRRDEDDAVRAAACDVYLFAEGRFGGA